MTEYVTADSMTAELQRKVRKRAVIVSGGTVEDPSYYRGMFSEDDLIICADSGYRTAQRLSLVPDVVIGDFDSFPEREAILGTKLVLPAEKDHTDTHECVCYALAQDVWEIVVIGAIGSRMDHTIANIHLLGIAMESGVAMKIVNEHNEIFLIRDTVKIPRREGWHFSLLPLEKTEGITLEGFYYPLRDAVMEFGNPYGVSNEFTAEEATVSIKKGLLLAILSRD